MKIPVLENAQIILQVLEHYNIKDIIISPGSRNAPLIVGFGSNSFFNCYSIVDERCAAFFALGIAQQTQKPAVLVCTSGSALLNYYPAIAESFYSQIPLIVISADRPPEKIDIGDGQTIRQAKVYDNHILSSVQFTLEHHAQNGISLQEAIQLGLNQKGPVHINVPFEEPLYDFVPEYTIKPQLIDEKPIDKPNNQLAITHLQSVINQASKIMILVGEMYPDAALNSLLNDWSLHENIVVISEKQSHLHGQFIIDQIDVLISDLNEDQKKQLAPDLLITLGGMLVSKRIKGLLRKFAPKNHIHIDPLRAYDTFFAEVEHLKSEPYMLLAEIKFNKLNSIQYKTYFNDNWLHKKSRAKAFSKTVPFSDWLVFDFLCKHLPPNIQIQAANSSVIRYLQLFETKPSWQIFSNRGTSGIEGSTSTAIGASMISEKPIIHITGDLSFLYDSNALWNNYVKSNFKIIIINNGGGGIFRILPGHQDEPTFNTFLETQHQLEASHLAKMFGFDYYVASDDAQLSQLFDEFIANSHQSILEIFTPTQKNDEVLKSFFNFIKN